VKVIKVPKTKVVDLVPPSHRVLLMGADSQVGLWVARSLGRAGLEVFCLLSKANGITGYSRYCSGAWLMDRSVNDSSFIEGIEKLARQLKVGSIMTIAGSYHLALIRHRELFEPEIHLFTSTAESFARATDKEYLHELARKLEIPVARGTTLDEIMSDKGR